MKQVCVISVFRRGNTIIFKPAVDFTDSINTIAPTFVTERWIGNHIIKSSKSTGFIQKKGIGQGITLLDFRSWVVMQNHIHPCQTGSG